MTGIQYKFLEALLALIALPAIFCIFNLIAGKGITLSDFEVGAIVAVVIIRLIEAAHLVAER